MSSENDREYQRREDARREHDRAVWRDQDLRDEDGRQDRSREDRRRSEEITEAWQALRRGDTAWAIRNVAGPDAGLTYLRAMENPDVGYEAANEPAEESPPWPKHDIVDTLAELVENVETAPPHATFDLRPPDSGGDVRVRALIVDPFLNTAIGSMWTSMRGGVPFQREHGSFWIRACLLRNRAAAATTMERVRDLIRDLP
ncbi:MAG TPA: hypothetical protein VIW24_10925 [Aldersonia sp.]